ncbi:radical SAM protein [Candidatus Woesearchaeota archaeon]|nr:radical SAM protein [Candidatus Woesearchaeota archaeon]
MDLGYKKQLFSLMGNGVSTAQNRPVSPEYVELIVNKSCFFRCRMCRIWKLEEPDALDLDDADNFLRTLKKLVKLPYIIYICGGETLAYRKLPHLIRKCSDYGFDTVITTNGWLLSEKNIKRLSDAGLRTWVLSLDSIDLKIHDSLRGMKGSGERVIKGIRLIKKINPEARVNINTVIMGENLHTLMKTVEWAESNEDISTIHLNAVTAPIASPINRKWRDDPEFKGIWPGHKDEVDKVIDQLIKFRKNNNKLVNPEGQLELFRRYFHDPFSFVINRPCHMQKTISIDADGSIYMCHDLGKIGNISDRKFERDWLSKEAMGTRQRISQCKKNCKMLINCNYKETV